MRKEGIRLEEIPTGGDVDRYVSDCLNLDWKHQKEIAARCDVSCPHRDFLRSPFIEDAPLQVCEFVAKVNDARIMADRTDGVPEWPDLIDRDHCPLHDQLAQHQTAVEKDMRRFQGGFEDLSL